MKYQTIAVISVTFFATACSGTGASYEPVLSNAASPLYATDLDSCRTLARSQKLWSPETRTQALIGGTVGALAGAADENPSHTGGILAGAAVGAIAGAAIGAADTRHHRNDILLQCLRDRGHPVAG